MTKPSTTSFGFTQIPTALKTAKVAEVFSSVASNYDLMNDVMSLGVHRLWKRYFVHLCHIGKQSHILDLAGGTGDIGLLLHKRMPADAKLTMCDINADMLHSGRDRFINKGIVQNVNYVQGNAEYLPFMNNEFDCLTMAFGLRNVTDKQQALTSMYDKLDYAGQCLILEFSEVALPLLQKLYQQYSFKLIPWLGKTIAKDAASYQYLVESIRMHPNQETLAQMMRDAGFAKVDYINLSGGIVSIHRGYKL